METSELLQAAHDLGFTPQDIDDIHLARLEEASDRFYDAERSFLAFLVDTASGIPVYEQAEPDGPAVAHDIEVGMDSAREGITVLEQEVDPENVRDPFKRHLLVIQRIEQTIKRSPPTDVLGRICQLGLLAATCKPKTADIPPSFIEAATDLSKPIRAGKRETPTYTVFRCAMIALRQQTKYNLTDEERLHEVPAHTAADAIAVYQPSLQNPNTAAIAASIFNKKLASIVAKMVLERVLNPNTNRRDVHDDLYVNFQVRALKAAQEQEAQQAAAAAQAEAQPPKPKHVRLERVPYAMLQPGTLRDWRRTYQPPEPGAAEAPREYKGRVIMPERLDLILWLYDNFGSSARLAARPLDIPRPAPIAAVPGAEAPHPDDEAQTPEATEPDIEERVFDPDDFDLNDYILVIREKPMEAEGDDVPEQSGQRHMVEDAVGICATTGNIIIVWHGQNGVQDGEVVVDWRQVFQYDKPNAYHNFPVLRMQFTPTSGQRILEAVNASGADFNAKLATAERRRIQARRRAGEP